MLSALIPSRHSYPAIHLVAKPVDQRSVQPGPLVTYSHITMCVDYIFTPHCGGQRINTTQEPYSGSTIVEHKSLRGQI